jgi:hypothetical protein
MALKVYTTVIIGRILMFVREELKKRQYRSAS